MHFSLTVPQDDKALKYALRLAADGAEAGNLIVVFTASDPVVLLQLKGAHGITTHVASFILHITSTRGEGGSDLGILTTDADQQPFAASMQLP